MKKNYKSLLIVCLILFGVVISHQLKASVLPNSMIVDFKPRDPRQKSIELLNESENISYMNIEIREVLDPGTKIQKKVPLSPKDRTKLVVSPNKATFRQGAKKMLKFITTEKGLENDKIYRVTILPKINGTKRKMNQIGIKILVGYEVLVIIRPEKMYFSLEAKRDTENNTITFKNNGNTNILLNKVVQCNNQKNDCQSLLHKRLYAGNQVTLPLPYNEMPVTCEIHYADKLKKKVF